MHVVSPSQHVLAIYVNYKKTRNLCTLHFLHHLLPPSTNLTAFYQPHLFIPTVPHYTNPTSLFRPYHSVPNLLPPTKPTTNLTTTLKNLTNGLHHLALRRQISTLEDRSLTKRCSITNKFTIPPTYPTTQQPEPPAHSHHGENPQRPEDLRHQPTHLVHQEMDQRPDREVGEAGRRHASEGVRRAEHYTPGD